MENAAKALLIAGGILLAIMTLTVLVYGLTSTGRIMEAQEQSKQAEELAKFNMEYEAYNKKRMYGIDVISVVNKAINNNRVVNAIGTEDPYYINIIIETKEDFQTTGKVINTKLETSDDNYENDMTDSEITTKIPITADRNITLKLKEATYELGTWKMDKAIIGFFEQNKKDEVIRGTGTEEGKVFYIYSALTNFKKAIFECKDVKYNDRGRIYEMTFEQIKIN